MSDVSPAVVVAGITVIAAPVAAGVNWFINRGKSEGEQESTSVSASNQAVESLRAALEQANGEIARLREQLDDAGLR